MLQSLQRTSEVSSTCYVPLLKLSRKLPRTVTCIWDPNAQFSTSHTLHLVCVRRLTILPPAPLPLRRVTIHILGLCEACVIQHTLPDLQFMYLGLGDATLSLSRILTNTHPHLLYSTSLAITSIFTHSIHSHLLSLHLQTIIQIVYFVQCFNSPTVALGQLFPSHRD